MSVMEQGILQFSTLYDQLRALRNPRKFRIFAILTSQKRLTTVDVAALLDDQLSYVCDALRQFEDTGLASRKGASNPLTKKGEARVTSRSNKEYACYESTERAELVERFVIAFDSNKPLANLSNLVRPEDIVRDCTQLERSELLKVMGKFKAMHNLSAIIVCLYYASTNHTADCNTLASMLHHSLNPDEVHAILSVFSGNDNLVIARYAPLKAEDRLRQRVARLLRGQALTRWLKRNRTTYSLTTEGERVAKRLAAEFRPQDLGINEPKLRTDGVFEYKGVQETFWSDLFSLFMVILLGLPIVVVVWIAAIIVFGWNLIKNVRKGRIIKKSGLKLT